MALSVYLRAITTDSGLTILEVGSYIPICEYTLNRFGPRDASAAAANFLAIAAFTITVTHAIRHMCVRLPVCKCHGCPIVTLSSIYRYAICAARADYAVARTTLAASGL